MRYYYYGINTDSTGHKLQNEECIKSKSIQKNNLKGFDISNAAVSVNGDNDIRTDGLIIEEDTVYEIDEECIRCKKK